MSRLRIAERLLADRWGTGRFAVKNVRNPRLNGGPLGKRSDAGCTRPCTPGPGLVLRNPERFSSAPTLVPPDFKPRAAFRRRDRRIRRVRGPFRPRSKRSEPVSVCSAAGARCTEVCTPSIEVIFTGSALCAARAPSASPHPAPVRPDQAPRPPFHLIFRAERRNSAPAPHLGRLSWIVCVCATADACAAAR